MATHYIPYGTTEPQTFTAEADGATFDGTGLTIALEVWDQHGRPVTLTGAVAWSDASVSEWSYTPDGQLTRAGSPYAVRLVLTDGTGADVKFPNGKDPDIWMVVHP